MKDPGLLDSVTRHLERKAALFKAVLEPARAGLAAQKPAIATA
jgi:hypothetical protein